MWEFLVDTGGSNFTGTAPLTWPSQWSGLPRRVGPLGKVTSFDRCIIIVRCFGRDDPGKLPKAKIMTKKTPTWKEVDMEGAEEAAAFSGLSAWML